MARAIGIAGALLVALATSARAQDAATSFSALQPRLKPGRTLTVTEVTASGKPHAVKGEFIELRPGAIVLNVKGKPSTFTESGVSQISERYRYSPRALTIGLAAGAAGGFVLDRLLVNDIGADTSFEADDALIVGIGAAVGAAIALHPRQRVVYRKTSTPALVFVPIAGRNRVGVAGSIRF